MASQVLSHWATPPAPHWGSLGEHCTTESHPKLLAGQANALPLNYISSNLPVDFETESIYLSQTDHELTL